MWAGSCELYLGARGVTAIGADLSAAMLASARDRNVAMALVQSDMRQLPFRGGCFGAVVAYYSIQHLPRDDLAAASGGDHQGPRPRAECCSSPTHLGEGDVFIDEFLGHPIDSVGGCLYRRDELIRHLEAAGFDLEVERQRGPLDHEADTQRIYLLVRCRLHR